MLLFCPRYNKILLCMKPDKSLLTRSRCKNWRCEYCAGENAKTLRKRISQGIVSQADYAWYFVTITSNAKDRSTEGTYSQIKKSWNNLLRQLKRDLGKLEYIMILELHKNKAFHAHAFIGLKTDYVKPRQRAKRSQQSDLQLYLKDTAPRYGFGYMCHAKKLIGKPEIVKVSAYIRKSIAYITKSDATIHAIPKHGRLYQQSRLFSAIDFSGSDTWIARNYLYLEDMRAYNWYDLDLKKRVTFDDFAGDVYPSPREVLDNLEQTSEDTIDF